MKKIFVLIGGLMLTALPAGAANFGGTDTTPTAYEVTVTKIEFRNSAGTYVTFMEGSFLFDIASVSANGVCGAIGAGRTLPAGTYNEIRVTFSKIFGITGAVANAGSGQPARTATGNTSVATLNGGLITSVSSATTDGATATKQSVRIPSGTAVTTGLATVGVTEVAGDQLQFSRAVSFSVEPGSALPAIQVSFDVTNTLELLTTGAGTAVAVPGYPGIRISISN